MGPIDRRQHPRVAISVDVGILSEHNFFLGKTRDISQGGLFLEGPMGLSVGALLTLKLKLFRHTYHVEAEVVWAILDADRKVTGVGVKFLNPPVRLQRVIRAYAALRPPIDYGVEEAEEPIDEPDDLPAPAVEVQAAAG